MNGAWIFQVLLVLVSSSVTAILGYLLGVKQQKKQALREHITEVVRKEYPALFSEIKRNSKYLGTYLDKPDYHFPFPRLKDFFDRGLDGFMKKHHKDLFLTVDFFQKKMLPRFSKLSNILWKSRDRIFDFWSDHLKKSLPTEIKDEAKNIVNDLVRTINPYYVLPDFLNERNQEVRNKIEACILDRTSHIYREKAKRQFVIKGQTTNINFDEVSNSLIEKAKPDVTNVIEAYKELKELTDKEVKEKLLPLLQKYISNPI
jgi:hypothetical protein